MTKNECTTRTWHFLERLIVPDEVYNQDVQATIQQTLSILRQGHKE